MKHWFIRVTEKLVQRVARAYGLRVEPLGMAYGQHPLIFDGGEHQMTHQVPRSCYFNTRSGAIRIGINTVFGEDVKVLTGKHASIEESRRDGIELHAVPASGRDIVFGEGCYVGSAAIIIGPVVVGDHSVIGAGAVVTKDVPPGTFVAGNPARLVRRLVR